MKEQILKLRKEGKTYNEIHELLGCSKSTISYHCSKLSLNNAVKDVNLGIKNTHQIKDSSFLLPDIEIINRIISLRKEKVSYKNICKELDISISVVEKVCKKFKLSNSRKFGNNFNINEIKKLYDELESTRKVAKELGIARETVRKYVLIKNHIKMTEDELKGNKVKSVVNWRKRSKLALVEYKGGKCDKCGYDRCVDALEFHHVDPTKKDFTISGKSWSFEKLKGEVEKCILVCSNCHKEIHFEIKNKLKTGT